MYCPHCGAENESHNRFCVNCGSSLSPGGDGSQPATFKQRVRMLIGTDRLTQMVTLGTIAALVIAVIAFLSLKTNEEGADESAYLQALDRSCVAEKERVIRLEEETLRQQPPDLQEFASVLVTIVAEWRADLESRPAPAEYAIKVQTLERSLLRILIEAGALARLAREETAAARLATQAKVVDEATGESNAAIEGLGLETCADLAVSPGSGT